jgi:hypothetical protein
MGKIVKSKILEKYGYGGEPRSNKFELLDGSWRDLKKEKLIFSQIFVI